MLPGADPAVARKPPTVARGVRLTQRSRWIFTSSALRE